VSCYVNEIFGNLRGKEREALPDSTYLQSQVDITPQMRAILVDWLVEVAEEYRLNTETLFLAVNYIDRFLSRVTVSKSQLQLVGVTCMFLASKYEEIYAPQVDEFCYITDNTYSREDMLEMECTILGHLDFKLTAPTIKYFLRRFLVAAHADSTLEYLAGYLCELSLIDYDMLRFPGSKIAAATVMLALHTLGRPAWTPTLVHYSQYTAAQLAECVARLHHIYAQARNPSALPAVREKYAQTRFKCVSKLMHPHDLPAHVLDRS